MDVQLEDVPTNKEIDDIFAKSPGIPLTFHQKVRACIRLAVEKYPEKVEGIVCDDADLLRGFETLYFKRVPPPGLDRWRHALLLLGPKYEPKPVKTDSEKVKEALALWQHAERTGAGLAAEMARIPRG